MKQGERDFWWIDECETTFEELVEGMVYDIRQRKKVPGSDSEEGRRAKDGKKKEYK